MSPDCPAEFVSRSSSSRSLSRRLSVTMVLASLKRATAYLQLWMLRGHRFRGMQCGVGRIRAFDDLLRLGHFCSRTMGDQQKLICRERRLVLHNAVLGDAYAEETGSQNTQRTYLYSTFQSCHDPRHQRDRKSTR